MKVYLGLDTSCYSTSCALVNESGELIGQARKLLRRKTGRAWAATITNGVSAYPCFTRFN